jgi:hypothetical protein
LCYETCLLTTNGKENGNINTFIADSGASAYIVHSKSLLKNYQEDIGEVKIGDSNENKSLDKGTFHGYFKNKDGETITITLNDVLIVPDLWVHLFSITIATSNKDWKVVCEENLVTVHTNNKKIQISKVLPHDRGKIMTTDLFTETECNNCIKKN